MESHGKYVVAYLIKGEAKSYHQNLTRKISEQFLISDVNKRIDPHLTLKYFNQLIGTREIEEVEKILKFFCETHNKARLKLKGISNFDNKIIFIDVLASDEMKSLYSELVKALGSLSWIKWHQFDRENIHFHATLAEGEDLQEDFNNIYNFASKERPDFSLYLDNVCILHKPVDKWRLYREFQLN